METLVLVAFAVVLVATAVGIDGFTDEIFVTFTCWLFGLFAFWALVDWTRSAAWSSTTSINIVGSDLVGSFFAFCNVTCLLRAFNNA
jgi:fatty acid desaturase